MTPNEKAKELVYKYYNYVGSILEQKECALIAVDEIIDELEGTNSTKHGLLFWQDVKQEIENL